MRCDGCEALLREGDEVTMSQPAVIVKGDAVVDGEVSINHYPYCPTDEED